MIIKPHANLTHNEGKREGRFVASVLDSPASKGGLARLSKSALQPKLSIRGVTLPPKNVSALVFLPFQSLAGSSPWNT